MPTREKSLAEIQQPKNDAYTVMLSISLVAMVAACILLYQEMKRYPTLRPTAKDMQAPAAPAAGGDRTTFEAPPAEGGGAEPKKQEGGAEEKKPEGGGEAKPSPGGNPSP